MYRNAQDNTKIFSKRRLFTLRKQNQLAAFMLHQATEQALGTLIKIGRVITIVQTI